MQRGEDPAQINVADNHRDNLTGKTNGWKTILNTLTIHYGDRIADQIK